MLTVQLAPCIKLIQCLRDVLTFSNKNPNTATTIESHARWLLPLRDGPRQLAMASVALSLQWANGPGFNPGYPIPPANSGATRLSLYCYNPRKGPLGRVSAASRPRKSVLSRGRKLQLASRTHARKARATDRPTSFPRNVLSFLQSLDFSSFPLFRIYFCRYLCFFPLFLSLSRIYILTTSSSQQILTHTQPHNGRSFDRHQGARVCRPGTWYVHPVHDTPY